MAQYSVHRNRNSATRARFPLLLDVQTDLLRELGTRVVIPLTPDTASSRRGALGALTPACKVDGKDYLLVTPQLAGIAAKELGPEVANLSVQRAVIVAALDFLITGI